MDERFDNNKTSKSIARRYGKRVLAVRAMAGETAWLDGRILWQNGRVAWQTDRDTVYPTAASIALAQRRLAQIKGYPRSSSRAFGDAGAWLDARYARLELAKQLQPILEPDIVALSERAQARHADAVARLVALLPAEAYCLNELPVSPSRALLACAMYSAPQIKHLLDNPDTPMAGRALAAILLGAAERQHQDASHSNRGLADWLSRAYNWGVKQGLPADPPLLVMLLAPPEGASIAERFTGLERDTPRFLPTGEELRTLLYRGISATSVVELCEACGAIEPVAVRIMQYRDLLADVALQWRRDAASDLQSRRMALVSELAGLVRQYAVTPPDPALLITLAQFMGEMLDLADYPAELAADGLDVLREGLTLAEKLRRPFFDVMLARLALIREDSDFKESAAKGSVSLHTWLTAWQGLQHAYVASLLTKTGTSEIVREALERGVLPYLSNRPWKDPELYRFALRLAKDLGLKDWWAWGNALGRFSTAREARTVLMPLAQAILAVRSADTRVYLAEAVIDTLAYNSSHPKDVVPMLVSCVPRLVRYIESPGIEVDQHWRAVSNGIALYLAVGDAAPSWLDHLLAQLEKKARDGQVTYEQDSALRSSLPLLLELASGDLARFDLLTSSMLAHNLDCDSDQISKAIAVLKRFPKLREVLARLFPLQPHRCMSLAVKMGFITRLGPDAYAPLGYLEGSGMDEPLPEEWQTLLDIAPLVKAEVHSYIQAQRVRGESVAVPPGVRKAIEQPRKLAAELAYLEARVASDPSPANITARAGNLRARLANEGKMMQDVRAEVADHLAQISAEAQIAAAEMKMQECYKLRLSRIAGPLPPTLEMNDDLVNATLLTVDVDVNRKLLVKMLRAYIRGDHRWREQHPTNLKVLADLSARGVNVDVWLAANPKRYACKGVTGGRVRLLLENNPLKVLQMGNYFDTCLSFGKFNSFSTIANACELNKRVIYAYDGAGRVVGRKLIGISDQGKLVGFHTYSTLGDEEGNALRALFHRYCADLAARCGLELADNGTIPHLIATQWYDDGTVAWGEDKARQKQSAVI